MLQPSNRLTLIDAMRPPAGYAFAEAMAVTFTLDLRALLAAPAAFALTASADGDVDGSDPTSEPVELLHAIRRHASNLTVFSQAGEISLPPSRKVFAFFEQAVIPVLAPRHGVVHPKVWVLRYTADEAPDRLRVLSASRNLTFDTSWDTLLRLDSTDDGDPRATSLAPLADLFRQLESCVVAGPLGQVHHERVQRLAAALERTPFALPSGVDRLEVHVLGFGATSVLPHPVDRSLVISPFVSADFLTDVHPGAVHELVSRPSALDALDDAALAHVGTPYVFDDGSAPEVERSEASLSAEDPGRPLRGLHAKVFAYETGDRAQVFVGSANATGAAFTSNVEILFELQGPRQRLGIDALLTSSKDELGLRRLIQTYVRGPDETAADTSSSLDAVRRSLGRLPITGTATPNGDGAWVVRYQTEDPITLPDGVVGECWPLAAAGNRTALRPGLPLDASFVVSLESISGFLAVELTELATNVVTGFAVPVQLVGMPEERDRHLLRSLIGSAERFLRYLLALLTERGAAGGLEAHELADALEGAGSTRAAGPTLPVLEVLLRSLRTDPTRILAIDPLVQDLAADDALPAGFSEIWTLLRDLAEVPT